MGHRHRRGGPRRARGAGDGRCRDARDRARGRIAHAPFRSLKDSKKLSAAQREFWAKELAGRAGVRFAVARVYPRGIERMNISAAANLAAARAFSRLLKDHKLPAGTPVYLDGGLYLGSKVRQQDAVKNGQCAQKRS